MQVHAVVGRFPNFQKVVQPNEPYTKDIFSIYAHFVKGQSHEHLNKIFPE